MDDREYDEKILIEQARHSRQAFGQLYERNVDKIYNYLYYRTGNAHDAEDLTARVFFRAIQHIEHYQDQGLPFSAWLYAIARNLLANWYRDRSKRTLVPLEHMDQRSTYEDPELTVQFGEDHAALLAAIRRLPAERQELLILKFVERLPNAEIGAIMGRSEGAIKSLYFRTLYSLRSDLSL